ncbi:MAG: hypothetical protein K6C12_07010 [Oscillospiraceae bacterium]|nr:hypothetical protein [Oscillospiraceae bacterium]
MKRIKKLSVIVLLAAIILSLAGFGQSSHPSASAETPGDGVQVAESAGNQKYIAPAEGFEGGDGTKEHPYQISTAAELAYLVELINGEYSSERMDYQQAHYILTADIVLNELSANQDMAQAAPEYNWVPIGVKSAFKGTFDGNQHSISGLYLSADVSDSNAHYGEAYGLFGENQGTIRNLSLTHSCLIISGSIAPLGGIAGDNALEGALIENCTVDAVLICRNGKSGGLVGYNSGLVSNCHFLGSIRELQDNGNTYLGGIVGYNSGEIADCRNEGMVTAPDGSSSIGGIAGGHFGGVITACSNVGEIDGGREAGGIVGSMFLNAGGGALEDTVCEVSHCVNEGSVRTKADAAGGIAGDVTNHHSKYSLRIADCQNSGTIISGKQTGGIAGLTTVLGPVACSGCENHADLTGMTVSGILASVYYHYGSLSVTDCSNSGELTASLYAGGIIADNEVSGLYLDTHPSLDIAVVNCSNTGNVSTDNCGAGVIGVFVCPLDRVTCEKINLTLENNQHSADIYCNHFNAFAGGIAANLGIPYASTVIRGCSADGCIRFEDIPADNDTIEMETGRMEFTRMAGGIVGRIGTGLFLSTTGDKKSAEAINNHDANIRFLDCSSSVRFEAPEESAYTYNIDGTPVFRNRFGGIVGYFSGAQGYTFAAENCRYTNAARALGDAELPDLTAYSDMPDAPAIR